MAASEMPGEFLQAQLSEQDRLAVKCSYLPKENIIPVICWHFMFCKIC